MSVMTLAELGDRFAAMPGLANTALRTAMQAAMSAFVTDVQTNKLSGQVLNVRSGRLRDSITGSVTQSGDTTSGMVGTDVPYAAIHEYGGTILRSRMRQTVIVEPERSYMRSTLDEQSDAVIDQLTVAVMQAIDP